MFSLPSRFYIGLAILFCGVIGLYDVAQIASPMLGGPWLGPKQWVWFPDFLTPYAAVRAFFEAKLAMVYGNIDQFTEYQNAFYADRFPTVVYYRPFLYPPFWLMLLLPLGLLAVDKATAVFFAVTAGASAVEGRRDPWGWLAMATSPAALHVVTSGQATFLAVALAYGGLRLLDRAPVAAGILFGLLAYKPQICLLIPVALIAAKQWRALISAAVTGAVLVLASLAVFGLQTWLDFIEMTRATGGERMHQYTMEVLINYMITPYVSALGIGLPRSVASLLQLGCAVLAVTATWYAFRYFRDGMARTAVLLSATFLVSPYMLNYDLLLLMPAALVLYRRGARTGFYPLEPLVYAAIWVIPTLTLGFSRHHLPVAPLVIAAFLVAALLRLRDETPPAGSARN
jgi:alpha-1,2-mannosyltransferase